MAKNSSPSGDSRPKAKKLPPGINLTPGGEYRARVYFQGKQQSIGQFQTITDAKTARSIAKSEIARGVFVPMSVRKAKAKEEQRERDRAIVTVDYVAEQFWKFLKSTGKTQGTIYTYQSRYRTHIAPRFGQQPIADITVAQVEDWYSGLLKAKGQGVSRSVYLTISSLFNYAAGKANGLNSAFTPYIDTSPVQVSGATKHRPERRDSEPVATVEQIEFLASHSGKYRLAILLSAWAAVRLGELIALQRSDLTHGGGFYWLRISKQVQARGKGLYETAPKSEAGYRTVPIPAALNDEIEAHLQTIPNVKDSLLFPRVGGEWTHPNSLRNAFNRARDEWNDEHPKDTLDNFTFHGLRHTALTHIGQAGATLEELKRYAGHTSAEVVAKYQHATRDRLAMLAGKLSGQIDS